VEITPEIRQAVAEDDCRAEGHDHDVVLGYGSADPLRLICRRCGRSWSVGPGVGGYGPVTDVDPDPEPDPAGR
jgi:hypothetical protein